MADNTHKVEIDIVADAKAFRDELKKTAGDAVGFNKNIQKLQKAGIKDDKVLQKITKDFAKLNKVEGKAALHQERQLTDVLKKKSSVLKDLYKAGKRNTNEYRTEQKALKETADLYTEIKQKRVEIMGLTRREKINNSGGAVLKWGALAALGTLVGGTIGRGKDAISAASDYSNASVGALGASDFNETSRESLRKKGLENGYSSTETMQQAAMLARQTGSTEDVTTAQQLSRTAMMDISQSAQFMGTQARGGVLGPQAKKEQEKIIAAGFNSGMTRGRLGEFMQGVTALSEKAQSRESGNVFGSGYASILAALGKSGKSGLQGERGANVLAQLEQGVMAPGGGEAGQALIMRSKGFGVPGGSTSYYDAVKRQKRGFAGAQGAGELKAFIDQIQKETGYNSEHSILAAGEVTGLSPDVLEQVFKVVNNMKGDGKDVQKQIAELTKGSLPMQEQVRGILSDKVAKPLLQQIRIQENLIRQGERLLPISMDIKEFTDKTMSALLDYVIPILESIRDAVVNVASFFGAESPEIAAGVDKAQSDVNKYKQQFGVDSPEFHSMMKNNLKLVDSFIDKGLKDGKSYIDTDMKSLSAQKNVIVDALNESEKAMQSQGKRLEETRLREEARAQPAIDIAQLERSITAGIVKGMQDSVQGSANIPAPIFRPTIIATDPVQLNNR